MHMSIWLSIRLRSLTYIVLVKIVHLFPLLWPLCRTCWLAGSESNWDERAGDETDSRQNK